MQNSHIRPTVTQQVRRFLDDQGVALHPWSGLEETYGELYSILGRRQHDPNFWAPLGDLLREILHSVGPRGANRLAASQAELLSSWDIDELVQDLRCSLTSGELSARSDHTAWKQFACNLSSQVLGGFLLLGLALSGCYGSGDGEDLDDTDRDTETETSADTSSDTDTGTDGDTDTDTDGDTDADTDADTDWDTGTETASDTDTDTWWQGCNLDQGSVLFTTLAESNLDPWSKQQLCACFTGLNDDWNTGLTQLFEESSPSEIAAVLQDMVDCCYSEPAKLNEDFAAAQQDLLQDNYCHAVLLYMGVSFPKK